MITSVQKGVRISDTVHLQIQEYRFIQYNVSVCRKRTCICRRKNIHFSWFRVINSTNSKLPKWSLFIVFKGSEYTSRDGNSVERKYFCHPFQYENSWKGRICSWRTCSFLSEKAPFQEDYTGKQTNDKVSPFLKPTKCICSPERWI